MLAAVLAIVFLRCCTLSSSHQAEELANISKVPVNTTLEPHSPFSPDEALEHKLFSPDEVRERKAFFLSLYGVVLTCVFVLGMLTMLMPRIYDFHGEINVIILNSSILTPSLLFLIFVYLLVILALPLLGIWAEVASCAQGFLWEVHTVLFAWLVVTRALEIALFVYIKGIEHGSVMQVACSLARSWMKLAGGSLAALDIYTDLNFVILAYNCGCYLWMFSLAIYIVGVVFLQAGQGFYHLYVNWNIPESAGSNAQKYGKNMRCALILKFLHLDLLYDVFKESIPRGGGEAANTAAYLCARCCCEDMLQGIVQVIYVVQFQKNYFVLFSLSCSLLSSIATTCGGVSRITQDLNLGLGHGTV